MTNEPLNNNDNETNDNINDECIYYLVSLGLLFCCAAVYISIYYVPW